MTKLIHFNYGGYAMVAQQLIYCPFCRREFPQERKVLLQEHIDEDHHSVIDKAGNEIGFVNRKY